ncbi:MAG: type I restriction-modification system endonuclease [Rhodoglobus sp.]|nr:type I restriction-modification system endonuclease [Rhodoglobus sp.]
MKPASENFGFLANQYGSIEGVAANAEHDWSRDPVGSLMRVRLFAELLARQSATKMRLYFSSKDNFNDVVDALGARGLPADALDLFHAVRRRGNDAAHRNDGTAADALVHLRLAQQLAVWFFCTFHDSAFKTPTFKTPEDPNATLLRLQAELAAARKLALEHQSAAELAKADADAARVAAEKENLERLIAEERADKEAADRALWEQMAQEFEAAAAKAPPVVEATAPDVTALIDGFLQKAAAAAQKIKVTEADVRRGIDEELRAAGWQADSVALTYAAGARPEHGIDRAIAEWPTGDGPADYVLFVGLRPVAVVEAKRSLTSAVDAIGQAQRYSRGYVVKGHESLDGGPWEGHQVPLVFATNGRPYLKQLENTTGVWFRDVRSPKNKARPLHGWMSPDGVKAALATDVAAAHSALKKSPVEALHLRGYQNDAILAVEAALAAGRSTMLVAMATGTGKTRTAIGLIYRLIEAGRFRRVLFLVDRSALGEQTANVIKDYKVASEKTFAQIFGFKELADASPDKDTRLHIATVQGMMKRVLDDDGSALPVDSYDCIVVDECHRGYTLDKEMSEAEMLFRDQREYVSRYRKVIEYFDAVKVGLTATPALHTTEIFGAPIFQYTYTKAVIDKVLVPQEPPIRIVTALARDGIKYRIGENVSVYNRSTGAIELSATPDELDFDVEAFNRSVKTPGFNQAVCAQLADEIDPHLDDKTLVFCVDDEHATEVTRLLKAAMDKRWKGIDDAAVRKITGRVDRPLEEIRKYRNEREPTLVVTVDLLTTGIDIPRICNLVFLRRVKSRILYEQMLGRATRLCPEIGKESFRVYDAVGQTELIGDLTDMKPVVVAPKFSFQQLAHELITTPDERAREGVLEQLLTKLRRKRAALEKKAPREFAEAAGMEPAELIAALAAKTPSEVAGWLVEHPTAVGLLDRVSGFDGRVVIHEGDDEVVEVRQDFDGKTPTDYLEAFGDFIQANMNRIPGLLVVKTAPRDLTRKQLKELAEALETAGYSEIKLQTAWRKKTNEDIAASIIGYIRQRALGEPLVPYAERVERAMKRVREGRAWTKPQRMWLDRIGKQMTVTTVVDRPALDAEPFSDYGGFEHVNDVFDGKAEEVLQAINDAVWMDVG